MVSEENPYLDQADAALQEASKLLHPNAAQQLAGDLELARKWLEKEIKMRLLGQEEAKFSTRPEIAFNGPENGLGLQSVRFHTLVDASESDLLRRSEHQSPTIGVFAHGMIEANEDEIRVGEIEIPIENGKGEHIFNLSKKGALPIRAVRVGSNSTLEDNTRFRRNLLPNHVSHGMNQLFTGYDIALRVVMEARKELIGKGRERTRSMLGKGRTYGCEFLNVSF